MTRRQAGSRGKTKPDQEITAYLNQIHAMAMEKITQIHEEYRTNIQRIVESWVTENEREEVSADDGGEDTGIAAQEDQVPEVQQDVRDDSATREAH